MNYAIIIAIVILLITITATSVFSSINSMRWSLVNNTYYSLGHNMIDGWKTIKPNRKSILSISLPATYNAEKKIYHNLMNNNVSMTKDQIAADKLPVMKSFANKFINSLPLTDQEFTLGYGLIFTSTWDTYERYASIFMSPNTLSNKISAVNPNLK